MNKLKKYAKFLLYPVLSIMFLVGWTLMFYSQPKVKEKIKYEILCQRVKERFG